jgi:hypothetical protein
MLSLLLHHIVVTLICSLAGMLIYNWLPNQQNRPLIFYPITGLIALTFITQVVALFVPVNAYVFTIIAGLILLGSIWMRHFLYQTFQTLVSKRKQIPMAGIALMGGVWLTVLVFSAGPTLMDDTDSYHIQMIKWLQEYGTVPGIANLHERYGFNSSWFLTIALFLPFSSHINFYTALNGLLSVWMSAFLISHFTRNAGQQHEGWSAAPGAFAVFVLSVLCWPLLRGNAATANYDFITTFLIVVLFIETIRAKQLSTLTTEWFLWPVFLFTVRIINFPLLLLSIVSLVVLLKHRQYRRALLFPVFSFFFVIPFIIRNVVLSGYPFYPASAFNLFTVDWKVDPAVLDYLVEYIKYFNRVNTMFLSIETTKQIPFPNWIGTWFKYLFAYDKPLLITGLLGFGGLLFSFRRINTSSRAVMLFCVVLLIQLGFWFLIAPDPRFVYGPLLVGSFLLAALLFRWKSVILSQTAFTIFLLAITLSLFGYSLSKISKDPNHRHFIVPKPLPQPPVQQIIIDSISLNVPDKVLNNWNPRCYATELPCLYKVDPRLRLRGKRIQEGFRLEK